MIINPLITWSVTAGSDRAGWMSTNRRVWMKALQTRLISGVWVIAWSWRSARSRCSVVPARRTNAAASWNVLVSFLHLERRSVRRPRDLSPSPREPHAPVKPLTPPPPAKHVVQTPPRNHLHCELRPLRDANIQTPNVMRRTGNDAQLTPPPPKEKQKTKNLISRLIKGAY